MLLSLVGSGCVSCSGFNKISNADLSASVLISLERIDSTFTAFCVNITLSNSPGTLLALLTNFANSTFSCSCISVFCSLDNSFNFLFLNCSGINSELGNLNSGLNTFFVKYVDLSTSTISLPGPFTNTLPSAALSTVTASVLPSNVYKSIISPCFTFDISTSGLAAKSFCLASIKSFSLIVKSNLACLLASKYILIFSLLLRVSIPISPIASSFVLIASNTTSP